MRNIVGPALGLALALGLAAPARAQETFTAAEVAAASAGIAAAGLTDTAHQYLWCAGAFMILKGYLAGEGAAQGDLDTVQAMADNNYRGAAGELKPLGMAGEDFLAMAERFYIVALSQTGPDGDADYTQEQCMATGQGAAP
jgi:hypothetical protein